MSTKHIFYFLFFLFSFFSVFSSSVSALTYYKYEGNPVLRVVENSWEQDSVGYPDVLFENGVYKMWYEGSQGNTRSIGYAESADGVNWVRDTDNPVLVPESTPDFVETAVFEPSVIKHESTYYLYYRSDPTQSIRLATSPDGKNWTKKSGSVLTPSSGGWDSVGVGAPHVIEKDGVFHLWYSGRGPNNPYYIGYALSSDGVQWTRHSQYPVSLPNNGHYSGPYVIYTNNQFHMYYHTGGANATAIFHAVSSDGVTWSCATEGCTVLTIQGISPQYDYFRVIGPSVLLKGEDTYVWYTSDDSRHWTISLATTSYIPIPTLTPIATSTPTSTPTPTLTPTPTEIPVSSQPKIILLPGMFGSWNSEAVLHNISVPQSAWKIPSVVKEYDGVTKTFDNLGYKIGEDFIVFAYDWRSCIEKTADELKAKIDSIQSTSSSPIYLVGHSLGGLVARTYLQKYGTSAVQKIVTVGSPHQGVARTYTAVSGGELDQENTLKWLGEKLVLQINRNGVQPDYKVLQEKLPSLLDLIPTYDFLKHTNGSIIPVSTLSIQNHTLTKFQSSFPQILPLLSTIVGKAGDTVSGYKVEKQSLSDRLAGRYVDGRPVKTLYEVGDRTVTYKSAEAGTVYSLSLDHGQIIYEKAGIEAILTALNIPFSQNSVTSGKKTEVSPSLIISAFSPVTISVEYKGLNYSEEDGLVFIPNADSGTYTVHVTGKEPGGAYSLLVGQIGLSENVWDTIHGYIEESSPNSQTETYTITFQKKKPVSLLKQLSDKSILKELIAYLKSIRTKSNFSYIQSVIKMVQELRVKPHAVEWGKELISIIRLFQKLQEGFRKNYLTKDQLNVCVNKLVEYIEKRYLGHLHSSEKDYLKFKKNIEDMRSKIKYGIIIR